MIVCAGDDFKKILGTLSPKRLTFTSFNTAAQRVQSDEKKSDLKNIANLF